MEKQNKAQVILSIVVGLLVLFFIFKWQPLLNAAGVIGVLALISDAFVNFLTKWWLKLAEFLGKINGYILLSVVFFIFLTPVAILMRIFKKSDELKLKKPAGTNYESRNHQYQAADMKNVW